MSQHICVCLKCGRQFATTLKSEGEIKESECPYCGSKDIGKIDPVNFCGCFSGGGSG
ncbi:MAG TPA: DNA-directed RNA polymerase subunit P [Nitrospiraceae bacterium]|nr:DNA-directed RNA polymerase subunit P [Nitrospiraceae bacterium]